MLDYYVNLNDDYDDMVDEDCDGAVNALYDDDDYDYYQVWIQYF